jgi:integrase/recombinase XerD
MCLVQNFTNYLTANKGLRPKTIKEYTDDLRLFINYLNDFKSWNIDFDNVHTKDVQKITIEDMESFIGNCAAKGNSASSRARRVSTLKSFYNYLEDKQDIKNIAKKLIKPKIPKRLPKYLTEDESIKLLKIVDGKNKERDYAIITLFLNCGLRLSELTNINLNHIRKNNKLNVIGKGDKERTIYLNTSCVKALDEYLMIRKKIETEEEALFLNESHKRLKSTAIAKLVKKYLKNIGKGKLSTHKLRHTSASLMMKSGVNLRTIQEVLGHADIGTTQIYTHIEDEELKQAANNHPLANL